MDLTEAEAQASLDYLLNEADEALISAFLVLLRAKGETFGEVHFFFFYCYGSTGVTLQSTAVTIKQLNSCRIIFYMSSKMFLFLFSLFKYFS